MDLVVSHKADGDKSCDELADELKKLRCSYDRLREFIARLDRLSKHDGQECVSGEGPDAQGQTFKVMKNELAGENEALRLENEELAAQLEEIVDLNDRLVATESALRKSEIDLLKAQRLASLGFWTWGIGSNEELWSDESFRIFGFEPGEVKPDVDLYLGLIHPADKDMVRASLRAVLDDHVTCRADYRVIRRDGSIRYIHSEGEIARDGSGRPVKVFGINQDITERKLAEEALKDAKSQAELYVDLMSHDIRNINQICLGYLELAIDQLDSEGVLTMEDRELLVKSYDVLMGSSRLIGNVSKVQRELAGLYRHEPIDVDLVLQDAIGHFAAVSGRNAAIKYQPGNRIMVIADELLKDVFLNLIGNAIKHSKDSVTIFIRTKTIIKNKRHYCKVVVEDTGPGIPDDTKSQLFDRLNLDGTKAIGKGFGLCLIKMLVDSYSGHFWMEDRVSGDHTMGSRFVVLLPLAGP